MRLVTEQFVTCVVNDKVDYKKDNETKYYNQLGFAWMGGKFDTRDYQEKFDNLEVGKEYKLTLEKNEKGFLNLKKVEVKNEKK